MDLSEAIDPQDETSFLIVQLFKKFFFFNTFFLLKNHNKFLLFLRKFNSSLCFLKLKLNGLHTSLSSSKKLVTNPDLSSLYQVNFRQHSCKFSQVKTFKSTSCGPHVHFDLFVSFFRSNTLKFFLMEIPIHSIFSCRGWFFLFIVNKIILKNKNIKTHIGVSIKIKFQHFSLLTTSLKFLFHLVDKENEWNCSLER